MMAYISRLSLLKNTIKNNPNIKYIITERSLFTDKYVFAKMLYDDGLIEHHDYLIYNKWFDSFIDDFNINKIIYINTSPKICHERIKSRMREGENDIPLQYLQNCEKYHDKMIYTYMNNIISSNKLLIDGNINMKTSTNNTTNIINKINSFIFQNI
jgi:deoxyadenosine/deoxycytidine kinase